VTLGSAKYFLSNNGQVFFETGAALLPRDTNGAGDVYEFDYYSGLHLISSGTGSGGIVISGTPPYPTTVLLGASPSGDDVFFLTRQALLPQVTGQEALSIYDARVDGGFPETAVSACTTADACRVASEPQPSIFGEPASQTFSGAGNLASPPPVLKISVKKIKCPKGKTRNKHNKCVKTKKKKPKAKKAAHTNRRASR
jgi:hypothetical protein